MYGKQLYKGLWLVGLWEVHKGILVQESYSSIKYNHFSDNACMFGVEKGGDGILIMMLIIMGIVWKYISFGDSGWNILYLILLIVFNVHAKYATT